MLDKAPGRPQEGRYALDATYLAPKPISALLGPVEGKSNHAHLRRNSTFGGQRLVGQTHRPLLQTATLTTADEVYTAGSHREDVTPLCKLESAETVLDVMHPG